MKLPTRVVRDAGMRPFGALSPLFDDNWDPFTEMATLRRTMNSIFDSALQPRNAQLGSWVPAVDLYEKDGRYQLEVAVPGLKKDDIDIEVADDRLTVSAKFDEEKRDDDARYHYREMRRGSFSRSITFPEPIDAENVSASYENGILKVSVPTTKPVASTKKVAIKG